MSNFQGVAMCQSLDLVKININKFQDKVSIFSFLPFFWLFWVNLQDYLFVKNTKFMKILLTKAIFSVKLAYLSISDTFENRFYNLFELQFIYFDIVPNDRPISQSIFE
jgi:hypothetical protein